MFKFYLNGYEYTPTNIGDFTLDFSLSMDSGSYQYVKSISGKVSYKDKAYQYIKRHTPCQKIEFAIKEFCKEGNFLIYEGYFTQRDCEFSDDTFSLSFEPKQNTLYQCLLDNIDRKFNFLEVGNAVEEIYKPDLSRLEFKIVNGVPFGGSVPPFPFFGEYVACGGSTPTPFFGFAVYVRETITTYCQGGELQPPSGTGWALLNNQCETKNLATWYRRPSYFDDPAACSIGFYQTFCTLPCTPATPPTTTENWVLMDILEISGVATAFWIDYNTLPNTEISLNNGRLFVEVVQYGLDKTTCKGIGVQSQLLLNEVNPVTGQSPSDLYELQIHAISDIKAPSATEPATKEDLTLKDLFEGYIQSKLNGFWRVDEGTKKVIIEHINDLNNQGVFTLPTNYTKLKNRYSYDNSDIPRAESFPSNDVSIDFTGVDIIFDNSCSTGVKSYYTDRFYSEVQSIIDNPDTYPSDGAVIITPNSLKVDGDRVENGAITGDYRPNAPQGMANMHDKYWRYYRPFEVGNMNFQDVAFTKNKAIKKNEPIQIPFCCLFFFNPYNRFVGNNFQYGQLQKATYNFKSGFMNLDINYIE